MPVLDNTRHEAFVQARFRGEPVMEAYLTAGFIGATPQAASKVSQHPDVKARLMELHNAAATTVAYDRMDAIRDLVAVIKAKPSEAAEDHPLCEVRTGRLGKYHRFPSKLRALSRLVKILGWDEPPPGEEDDEDTPPPPRDTLLEALESIRTNGAMPGATGAIDIADITDADSEDEWDEGKATSADADQPLSPLQEAFAQARFGGLGVMEAYQAAGYQSECPQRASRVNRHPAVKARLASLRKAAEHDLPYKRHEAINDLIAIIQATPAEAGPDHELCETRMGPEGEYHRFPCKLSALMLLIKIMRWEKPLRTAWQSQLPARDTLKEYYEFVMRRAGVVTSDE